MLPSAMPVEVRVTNLEVAMVQLIAQVDRTSRGLAEFKEEMREFKEEMLDFKNEMRDFKNEMLEFKDEMRDFKNEMLEFKDEMHDFKDESERFRVEWRKQWGELANKLGTMAEDLVAPSIGRILRETIGCPEDRIEAMAVRMRKTDAATGDSAEFDVIAACGDYLLLNETKSQLRVSDVRRFRARLPQMRRFFPEYADKKIVGAIASLYVDENLVRLGEKLGLIVLGFGDDVMQVLNSRGFQPAEF